MYGIFINIIGLTYAQFSVHSEREQNNDDDPYHS